MIHKLRFCSAFFVKPILGMMIKRIADIDEYYKESLKSAIAINGQNR